MSYRLLLSVFLFVGSLSVSFARADDFLVDPPTPGVLADFGYTMNDVGNQAGALFASLNRDTKMTSICANRAHIWTYDLARFHNVRAAKIFLFYTAINGSQDDVTWWYHVAPLVLSNGQYVVLDGGFPGSVRGPVTIGQWLNRFARTPDCTMLTAADDDLEQYFKIATVLPSTRGVCYYRLTPMYYQFPISVAYHDIDGTYSPTGWNSEDLIDACMQGMSGGFIFKRHFCKKYLGLR